MCRRNPNIFIFSLRVRPCPVVLIEMGCEILSNTEIASVDIFASHTEHSLPGYPPLWVSAKKKPIEISKVVFSSEKTLVADPAGLNTAPSGSDRISVAQETPNGSRPADQSAQSLHDQR
jgi:hypothetical protein